MKPLKITDKNITLKTFEKMVKQRIAEFKTEDNDVLALQFIEDSRTVCVGPELAEQFYKDFGNSGALTQGKAAKNFVYYVRFGEKLYP